MRRSGPTARVLEDELAHLALGVGLRMPQPGADETLARFQVDVERWRGQLAPARSEEHTSELQSLMRISYAVFCLKKKINTTQSAPQCKNTITTKKHPELQ